MLGPVRPSWGGARPVRVAYTLEQCWHDVPGGTAVAALRDRANAWLRDPSVELVGVAGRHRRPPPDAVAPAVPGGRSSRSPGRCCTRAGCGFDGRRSSGRPDPSTCAHATGLVPCADAGRRSSSPCTTWRSSATPTRSPGTGSRVMRRSLERDRAPCRHRGVPEPGDDRPTSRPPASDRIGCGSCRSGSTRPRRPPTRSAACAPRYDLPARFVLFVGTHRAAQEPRAPGAGGRPARRAAAARHRRRRRLGRRRRRRRCGIGRRPLPRLRRRPATCPALYAAATVFAYPSEWEGFGLPVAEAMAQGTPVSRARDVDGGGRRRGRRARRPARRRRHRTRSRRAALGDRDRLPSPAAREPPS